MRYLFLSLMLSLGACGTLEQVDPGPAAVERTDPFRGALPRRAPAPPRVVGAISLDPQRVRVQFSTPMLPSATDPAVYEIEQLDDEAGATRLRVLSAEFVGGDFTQVDLSTAPQGAWDYGLRAVGVTDVNKRPMAAPQVVDGVVLDFTRTRFVGTPLACQRNGDCATGCCDQLPGQASRSCQAEGHCR